MNRHRDGGAVDDLLREVDRRYLWPSRRRIKDASERADRLVDELHRGRDGMFSVVGAVDHGSLSRGTGIRHFEDFDRIVLLDPDVLRTKNRTPRTAGDTISRFASCIRRLRAGLIVTGVVDVRSQEHSVGVTYGEGTLRLDLVPGIRDDKRILVPESTSKEWISTDPAAVLHRLERAEGLVPGTRVAIRLLKGWARARGNGVALPSFAIETLVVHRVLTGRRPSSLGELIQQFFSRLGDVDGRRRLVLGPAATPDTAVTVIDPVSKANLTEELSDSHRRSLIRKAKRTITKLEEAMTVAPTNRTAAERLFRQLFVGPRWE